MIFGALKRLKALFNFTDSEETMNEYDPEWSFDGSCLVFSSDCEVGYKIFIINLKNKKC